MEWIGAQLQAWIAEDGIAGITITILAEKLERLRILIDSLLGHEVRIPKKELRAFTGLMTWVPNVCPQCSAFCRMLWGALFADRALDWVAPRQVAVPLQWLHKFCTIQTAPLRRNYRPRSEKHVCVTFDGSPTGGGAILQYGLTDISSRGEFPIAFYWRTTWIEQ